jgi:hypothetical protein
MELELLTWALMTYLGQVIPCCGACPVHGVALDSIPGVHPLDNQHHFLSLDVTTKHAFRQDKLQCGLWTGTVRAEPLAKHVHTVTTKHRHLLLSSSGGLSTRQGITYLVHCAIPGARLAWHIVGAQCMGLQWIKLHCQVAWGLLHSWMAPPSWHPLPSTRARDSLGKSNFSGFSISLSLCLSLH